MHERSCLIYGYTACIMARTDAARVVLPQAGKQTAQAMTTFWRKMACIA